MKYYRQRKKELKGKEERIHAALHPEVGPVQHLLPEGDLLPLAVHPGHRPALVLARAQVEAASTQEVLHLAHAVVVPDGNLETLLLDLLHDVNHAVDN